MIDISLGVKFLDESIPDWRAKIQDLDMRDLDRCVLGQLFGGYRKIEEEYGEDWCIQHGFQGAAIKLIRIDSDGDTLALQDSEYETLQTLWLEEIGN
jgi:hypothetical protein